MLNLKKIFFSLACVTSLWGGELFGMYAFNEQTAATAARIRTEIDQLQRISGGAQGLQQLLQRLSDLERQKQQTQEQAQAAQRQQQQAQQSQAAGEARAQRDHEYRMQEPQRLRAQAEARERDAETRRKDAEAFLQQEAKRREEKLRFEEENAARMGKAQAAKVAEIGAAEVKVLKDKITEMLKFAQDPATAELIGGVFAGMEKLEEIKSAKAIELANIKWTGIRTMFNSLGSGIKDLTSDPKRMAMLTATIVVIIAAYYGSPILWNYVESVLNQPRVVAETSKVSWLGKNNGKTPKIKMSDVIMDPGTHKQLIGIADRIRLAKKNGENFFNVLLYGEPGTGKTMFARALSYYSGLDYAITSGSEFAKITNTNQAITELHKLVDWANHSEKGLIVFIDEAESFLAERRLPTTTKWSQDMLNAFLAAVPKPTSDKIMFVFATNHPFKLDKAVISRVGERVEFKLPAQPEREKIIRLYVTKFSKDKAVKIDKSFEDGLVELAKELEGIAPREIEYFADKVTSLARSENKSVLTIKTAQDVAVVTKQSILAAKAWEAEQKQWVEQQLIAAH